MCKVCWIQKIIYGKESDAHFFVRDTKKVRSKFFERFKTHIFFFIWYWIRAKSKTLWKIKAKSLIFSYNWWYWCFQNSKHFERDKRMKKEKHLSLSLLKLCDYLHSNFYIKLYLHFRHRISDIKSALFILKVSCKNYIHLQTSCFSIFFQFEPQNVLKRFLVFIWCSLNYLQ